MAAQNFAAFVHHNVDKYQWSPFYLSYSQATQTLYNIRTSITSVLRNVLTSSTIIAAFQTSGCTIHNPLIIS